MVSHPGFMDKDRASNGPPGEEPARQRILDAAVDLFCAKGYEATSVREIVEKAGVTKPALYYYFKNKEDLFHEIIVGTMAMYDEQLNEACRDDGRPTRQVLEDLCRVYIEAARSYPDLLRFIHAIAYSLLYEDVFQFTRQHVEWLRRLAEALRRGQRRREISADADVDLLALNFQGMLESNMRGILYFHEDAIQPATPEDTVRVFLEGAGPRSEKTPPAGARTAPER